MSFFIIYPPISPDFTYLWDRKRKRNNRMQLLYVIGTGVLAAFCVLLAVRICYQRRYIRTSDRINDCIFRNVAAYLLLIDPDFNVLQTNYRSATGNRSESRTAQGGQPAALQERRGRRRLRHARIVRRLSRSARPSPGCSGRRKASRDWRSRWCSTPPTTTRRPSTAT